MHYLTLVTAEIPVLDTEQKAALKSLHYMRNAFSKAVNFEVTNSLEPYAEGTRNPDYLEFCDKTMELYAAYQGGIDCFKLPEGRIVPTYYTRNRYTICDGKVYECHAGPLKHKKRTKRAKRIKAMPDYPISKFYPTIASFAEDYYGYIYEETQDAYGYYYNPNAFFDWYTIGGRWPDLFLVKNSCAEYSTGECSWTRDEETIPVPAGYKWVCAARKKDIEWAEMKELRLQEEKDHFKSLETLFTTGKRAKDLGGIVTEDGIVLCNKLIYKKGESEESYLSRLYDVSSVRYPVFCYNFLNDDGLQSKDSLVSADKDDKELENEWHKILDHYLDSLADDTVLVAIDSHI